jgi:lipoprotein-anchoring transpeptidase ErfK/SrfK
MTGPAVQQLRQRLANLRFDVDPAKASFDTPTYFAVVAFQKQQNLPRTGKADQNTLNLLAGANLGTPMLPNGEPTRIEIDLKRQVLQYWIDGRLTKVLPVSTGSGQHYCVPASKGGGCATAVTPGGSFRVNRKILGLRVSKLGELYNPMYFNGGIAIHGEPAVPNTPGSHGCVRIPMNSSLWMFNSVTIGTPVYVLGGHAAPVPFNELAPPDPAAPATTAPPPTIGPGPTTTVPSTKPPGFPI